MVFVTGGSEAVESCLKLALQYHAASGEMSRRRFIARERSWHGNTLGALSVSGFLERRAAFEGALGRASHISPANDYRPPGRHGGNHGEACAKELEDEILRLGAERSRPSSSSRSSARPAAAFPPLLAMPSGCARSATGMACLLIADEVMCGSGRCGTWRALAHDGVEPDIMSVAKGLAAGYLPLGAAIYSRQGCRCHRQGPWRPDDRPHLHRPHRLLCGWRRGAEDHRARRSSSSAWRSSGRKLTTDDGGCDGRDRGGRRHSRPRASSRHSSW